MKKHLLLIVILFLCNLSRLRAGEHPPAPLSGTYLVGSSQPVFKKLTDVANALNNAANTVTGDVIFELDSDYDGTTGETFPIVFNQFNSSGNWTVTIRPKAGVSQRTTAGNPGSALALITFNGTDKIILDGRPGGEGSSIGWLIRNTNATTTGDATIYLLNDAQNNTFTWLQLEGQTSTTAVLYVGGTTGTYGNDNNTISYCRVRDRSDVAGMPAAGILFKGNITSTPDQRNSGNTITQNDIINICGTWGSGSAISVGYSNTEVTVTHNNIYVTASLNGARITFSGISVSEKTMSGVTISDNFIGGTAPSCGGAPFTIISTSRNTAVAGIYAGTSDGTGTGNVISNNTITNFDIRLGEITHDEYYFKPFVGITVSGTKTQVSDNIIGNTAANDAIKITLNNGTASTYFSYGISGISFNSRLGGSVTGNKFGGVTVNGSMNTSYASSIMGIVALYSPLSSDPLSITRNIIGSAALSNNIRVVSSSIPVNFYGVYTSIAQPVSQVISGNTIAGISLGYTGTTVTSEITGIRTAGASNVTIDSNLVSDISSASLTASASPALLGIWSTADSSAISRNVIRRLRLTGTSSITATGSNTTGIYGISLDGLAKSADVYQNQLYDFTSANTISSGPTHLEGINIRMKGKVYNNLVSLDNGSNTNNCEIMGVRLHTATTTVEILHNTLYIGGGNGAASNTAASAVVARSNTSMNIYLRSNLLVNARTGGNSSHYLFYNPVSPPATGWPTVASNNNVLVIANINKIGRWNTTDRDSTQWKTVSDANSSYKTIAQVAPASLFTSLTEFDIKDDAWDFVKSKGAAGTGTLTDYVGESRYLPAPTAGAYEFPLAALKALVVSAGQLSPVFHRRTMNYTDTVDGDVGGIMVTPTVLNTAATVKVNGTSVVSGNASAVIPLNIGTNTISIVVTAPGGVIKTYTIKVMRKQLVLAGTYPVGSSQLLFKKLTDVATMLNSCEVTGNVLFELNSDYDGTTGETFPITFKQFNAVGGNWTATIRPKAGVSLRTTSGPASTKNIITLDSTDNLILDGRPGGTGNTIGWLIQKTSNSGATIQLQNDAQNNTLTWLQLEGQTDYTGTGIVFLAGTTGTQGNDNNTISYCKIRARGNASSIPAKGIYSKSTATDSAAFNSGNIITHNSFPSSFYRPASTGIAIHLDAGNTATAVTYNSIYQEQPLGLTVPGTIVYGIAVIEPLASDMNISHNYIGGSAPEGSGWAYTLSNTGESYSNFYGIAFNSNDPGTGINNIISDNTIRNFKISVSTSPQADYSFFTGIRIGGGNVDVVNNYVGSVDGYDDIIIADSSSSDNTIAPIGIEFTSRAGGNITGNKIAGITIEGNHTSSTIHSLYGIRVSFTPVDVTKTININDNIIGSTTIPGIIRSTSATMPLNFTGIYTSIMSNSPVNFKNNTVAGISLSYEGSANIAIAGISQQNRGICTFDGNLVTDISSASLTTGTSFRYYGIWSAASSPVIRNNTVKALRLTGTVISGSGTDYSAISGIMLSGASGTATVYNNKIYDLTSTNQKAGAPTVLRGIHVRTNADLYNNLISLDNGSNTNNCEIRGIHAESGTVKLFHNTVYIGGNNGATGNTAFSSAAGRSATSPVFTIRNNLLVNDRAGGNGAHYIYDNGISSPTANWTSTAVDYNVIVTRDLNKIGRWSTSDVDSAQWKASRGDAHSSIYSASQVAPSSLFENLPAVDLSIQEDARVYVAGKGTSGTGITADYAGTTRSTTAPSAGAYEYVAARTNAAPTAVALSPATVSENVAAGSVVGTLTATDPDEGETFTYSLVAGTGSTDNASFSISGDQLKVTGSPDRETKSSYDIRIRATDAGSLYFEKEFTVTVTDVNDNAPVITSHSGAASLNLNAAENQTTVTTVTASDADASATLVYSIVNSEDGAYFTVNSTTGALVFNTAPDFEHPADPDENNLYMVTVQVSDGVSTATQRFKVRVTNLNDNAPEFGSYGGDAAVTLKIPENTTAVGTVWAVDKEPGTTITYSIASGQDGARFSINPVTGVFVFVTAPDFEKPTDEYASNVYIVTVQASDGELASLQRFKIKITDVNEGTGRYTNSTLSKAQTATGEINTSHGIKVYPNPVTNKRFTLQVDSIAAGPYMLELYTPGGQLVHRQQLNHSGHAVFYPVQLPAGLSGGVYLLRLTGVHVRYTERLKID